MNSLRSALVCIVCIGAASPLAAQSASERGYVTAAADFLAAGSDFTDTIHPIQFGEPSTITTSYHLGFAPGFAIGGGARVWRQLAVGVEVGRTSRAHDGDVSAQVPHPFFFNQPRSVSGTVTALDRTELAVHVLVSWIAPISRSWQLAVSGGPSWITVDQDVVSDIAVTQTYPYDTATFASAMTQRMSNGHAGFNAGVNALWFVAPHAAIDFGARYAHASVLLTSTATTDAGGAHVTAGLRLRF
jgi:hypothetical protein